MATERATESAGPRRRGSGPRRRSSRQELGGTRLRRLSLALSLGGKLKAIDATHVLGLLFPLLGTAPAVAASVTAYMLNGTEYTDGSGAADLRYTPVNMSLLGMPLHEPFAALSNLSMVFAGVCVFLMPFLSDRSDTRPTAY